MVCALAGDFDQVVRGKIDGGSGSHVELFYAEVYGVAAGVYGGAEGFE
jgi:hypothetical protein